MAFTTTNPVSVDEATKADDYDVVFDNTIALSEFQIERALGGSIHAAYTDTTYVPIDNFQLVYVDGTNLSGLSVYFIFNALVATGTGYVRLYNGNLASAVSGSEVTFTNTTVQYKSVAITLASGSANYYYAQIKGSTAAVLPRMWGGMILAKT